MTANRHGMSPAQVFEFDQLAAELNALTDAPYWSQESYLRSEELTSRMWEIINTEPGAKAHAA